MKVQDLIQVCTYDQWLRITRTNDCGENRLIADGPKQIIVENMDEEIFAALNDEVVLIFFRKNKEILEIICEEIGMEKVFFRLDRKDGKE